MTPFFCSLVYPLSSVDTGRLSPEFADERERWVPQVAALCLRVARVELVTTEPPWSATKGFLVVHVESLPGTDEQDALDELAQLARPANPAAVRLLESLRSDRADVSWDVADVRRVPTVALTGEPIDDRGSVAWPGSTAVQRRIASLLVLREGAIDVDLPFEMEIARPTPSYLLTSSGPSTVLMRLRPLGEDHVERLRTVWVDVLLVKLTQHATLSGLADEVRRGVDQATDVSWEEVQTAWRRWRTTEEWGVEADRPLEMALEHRIRAELGSPQLGERIAHEIDVHSSAERLRQDRAMARAVLLLAVAAALVPLLLQVSQTGAQQIANGFFVSAVVVTLGVGALALTTLRQRPRVAGTWGRPETSVASTHVRESTDDLTETVRRETVVR